MKFNDKLVFLMKLTNTTNSTLARATSLDASFISRLRSGAREPSKKQNYISSIALFFARNIFDNYQKTALCDVMHLDYSKFPDIKTDLKHILDEWLLDNNYESNTEKSHFPVNSEELSFSKASILQESKKSCIYSSNIVEIKTTYGHNGRRDLVSMLYEMIYENGSPDTVYLVSEENISWFTEDPLFVKHFYNEIFKLTAKGNKIKIIHNIKQNLNDMYSMLQIWLPLYVSGAIEPYYYPKIRDGLIKNTLIVAPKSGAVFSFSIGEGTKNTVNLLITDKKTVSVYLEEFKTYLSVYKPLIQISYPKIMHEHLEILLRFEQAESDSLLKTTMFSSLTMSEDTFRSIIKNANAPLSEHLLFGYHMRKKAFLRNIKTHSFSELIYLPSIKELKKNSIKANIYQSIGFNDFYYTKHSFINHINEIINYLEKYPNYNINLISKDFLEDCQVYIKKDIGVILSKIDSPMMIVSMTEPTLIDVTWNYLINKQSNLTYANLTKDNTIKTLKNIVKEINTELY